MDTDIPPSAFYVSLLASLPSRIQSLNEAIEKREHLQTIQLASDILHQICQSKLHLARLDVRLQAHWMQGQFDLALSDGEQMIKVAPASAAGYLRKGELLSMYGWQSKAISTYNEGIKAVPLDPIEVERLVLAQSKATMLRERKIDFIARLPPEITTDIFAQLPQEVKAICLTVSKTWHSRVIDSANDWRELVVNDDQEHISLLRAIPFIGRNIQVLILDTASEWRRSVIIKRLREGCFENIRSLEMTARTTTQGNFGSHIFVLSTAFWQIRTTLTKLQIDLGNAQHTLSMADLLLSCSNLTDLTFSTKLPMSTSSGDFTLLSDHPLLNLEIRSDFIAGMQLQDILRKCQNIRRLVMYGCDTSVIDPIFRYAQNLEILGYNFDELPVPYLRGTSTNTQGLRKIYINNSGGTDVPAGVILPLIYKHMYTLETIHLRTLSMSEADLQRFYDHYPDFRLKRVTSLTFWSFDGIQQVMLRAIENATNLSYLSMVNIHNICEVVDTIVHLPALTRLRLSHVTSTTNKSSFLRLFETYAARSESLESITLSHCADVIDAVLASLAKIKTLRQVDFAKLNNISTRGLTEFLHKVNQQLTYIKLDGMKAVTDYHLVTALSGQSQLAIIHLSNLPMVTDNGIREMVDKANGAIQQLVLWYCNNVTVDSELHAKKTVKTVLYIE